jgi:hypothetical protein
MKFAHYSKDVLDPMIDALSIYVFETLALFAAPLVFAFVVLFRDENKIAVLYGIREGLSCVFFLVSLSSVILSFLLIFPLPSLFLLFRSGYVVLSDVRLSDYSGQAGDGRHHPQRHGALPRLESLRLPHFCRTSIQYQNGTIPGKQLFLAFSLSFLFFPSLLTPPLLLHRFTIRTWTWLSVALTAA